MMRDVEVTAEVDEPPDSYPSVEHVVERAANALGADQWNISVLLCSDDRIRELNREYREIDAPTDVLSFAASENPDPDHIEGDIAISLESVERNAHDWEVPARAEFVRVIVHAMLHLAGYEHGDTDLNSPDVAGHPMLGLQEDIVRRLLEEAEE
jgi:probable rRNA maturation factor